MKNIKNILGMGAFMLLTSLAVSSCTEKSDWDIDSSYSRPFGTDENGISIESSQSGSNLELNIQYRLLHYRD